MCPTQQKMVERGCAGDCVINPNVVKNTILSAAAIVVFFGALSFWLHLIEYVILAVGALTIGSLSSYWYVTRRLPIRRQRAAELVTNAQQAMQGRYRQPLPVQQQALPTAAPEVHQHLHLHGADAVQQYQERR